MRVTTLQVGSLVTFCLRRCISPFLSRIDNVKVARFVRPVGTSRSERTTRKGNSFRGPKFVAKNEEQAGSSLLEDGVNAEVMAAAKLMELNCYCRAFSAEI